MGKLDEECPRCGHEEKQHYLGQAAPQSECACLDCEDRWQDQIDQAIPSEHPDDWTAGQWTVVNEMLEDSNLPQDYRDAIEAEIMWRWDNMIDRAAVSDLLNQEDKDSTAGKYETASEREARICVCNAEQHRWVHLKSCPAWEDKYHFGGSTSWSTCKHDRVKFELFDGLHIRLSAYSDVQYVDSEDVDVGVYLTDQWLAQTAVSPGLSVPWAQGQLMTKGIYMDWPDMGGHKSLEHVVEVVDYMLEEIEKGVQFEIGCWGGHGRTGTLLACVLVRQGLPPPYAVRMVRESYCAKAIESSEQMEFIELFAKRVSDPSNTWRRNKKLRKVWNEEMGKGKDGWKLNPKVNVPLTSGKKGTEPFKTTDGGYYHPNTHSAGSDGSFRSKGRHQVQVTKDGRWIGWDEWSDA